MDHKSGLIPAAMMALILVACGEDVVLSDTEGWLELRYDCSRHERVAQSSAEHAIVREYAKRIILQASRDDRWEVALPIVEADGEGRAGDLERLVVDHVCRDGAIAAPADVQAAREQHRIKGLERGVVAPDFIAPLINSRGAPSDRSHVRLSDLRGEYVILNFWATWCSPCLDKHPQLVSLAERYSSRGLRVLGIVHRDRPESALEWLRKHPSVAYESVVDETGRIADAYGVDGIPRVFLVDPGGQVIDNVFSIDAESLDATLARLLTLGDDQRGSTGVSNGQEGSAAR